MDRTAEKLDRMVNGEWIVVEGSGKLEQVYQQVINGRIRWAEAKVKAPAELSGELAEHLGCVSMFAIPPTEWNNTAAAGEDEPKKVVAEQLVWL